MQMDQMQNELSLIVLTHCQRQTDWRWAGNDTIFSGAGSDSLTGGIGADIFQFAASSDENIITDFKIITTMKDKIELYYRDCNER